MAAPQLSCACAGPCEKTLPPSVATILRLSPDIVPDGWIDRAQPRCRACDRAEAEEREFAARQFHTQGTDVEAFVRQARRQRQQAVGGALAVAVAEEKEKEKEHRLVVGSRVAQKTLALRNERAAIFLAWQPFWAVWGRDGAVEGRPDSGEGMR